MANIVTATAGVDLGYPFRTMGGPFKEGNLQRDIGRYYLDPAGNGEPPGQWIGAGIDRFGLSPGGLVDEKIFKSVYSGKHPETGEQLGRKASGHLKFEDHLARLVAAEPHATAERMEQLRREAAQATRSSAAYVDVTNDWSKSISIAHASIRQNLYHAKAEGDLRGVAYWSHAEALFSEALQHANAEGMRYAQEHAGYTRTGNHTRVEGKDTGRYAAGEMVVATFLQGTNREGEMHDHAHNTVWSKVFTADDGKVRALDTMALRLQLPAIQAVIAAAGEAELTRLFGFEWVPRPDGKGNEIRGVTQEIMDGFSTRGQQVSDAVRVKAAEWERDHGTPPTEAQLKYMRDAAWYETRRGKEKGELDWDAHARRWDRTSGGALAAVISQVSDADGKHELRPAKPGKVPTPWRQRQIMSMALSRVQEKSSTWTRADLMREVAAVAGPLGTDPARAVALVEDMTGRAIRGEVSLVLPSDAPQYPAHPDSVRRPDGGSVYKRPGSERYSTDLQLSLEQRLISAAGVMGSPHLEREKLAGALGATPEALTAQLRARAVDSREILSSGLRLDQAAALFHVLTSERTASVLVGSGGTGKSHCAAFAAKTWKELSGGDVIGVTPSQASRNVLRDLGMEAYNFADYLGHAKDERGARGAYEIKPGTLVILDESSMFSTPDMTDIIEHAVTSGAHVVVIGDHGQLQAVESGGGMMLLAAENEYVQLSTPVRFHEEWERDASLNLRSGNVDVLHEYEEHGRLRSGDRENVMDQARQDYVAKYLSGNDVLLMSKSNAICYDLSNMIRDDLQHLGLVSPEDEVTLSNGAKCSPGDLLINRDVNYEDVANGDTLRLDSVKGDKATVSKLLGSKDGERIFSDPIKIPASVITDTCRLGYAVTFHCAQGRTVDAGRAIITGAEDRQAVYVGMSRGRDSNVAYVVTPVRTSDPSKGAVSAVSLERYDRTRQERSGMPQPEPDEKEIKAQEAREADGRVRDRIALMSDVLMRDGAEQSATAAARHELSLADHLGHLNAILTEETKPARNERYTSLVREVLPVELKGKASYATPWLYRTLRSAEAAGMDAKEVLERAVSGRSFDGLRDHIAGLKKWIEKDNGAMVPAPRTGWAGGYEKTGDPEKDEFLDRVATAMDERRERLGPFVAESQPLYAVRALGPVPEDPGERGSWEEKAKAIETYREIAGYRHETDAIGPEPINSPDNRQLWHTAFEALGPADGFDARALSDGSLLRLRESYVRETQWAPRHVVGELSAVRVSLAEHDTKAVRAEVEAKIARQQGDGETARRHEEIAGTSRMTLGILRAHEEKLQAAQQVREEWAGHTERSLQNALAADSEYRSRHPEQELEPLKSAEPEALSAAERDELEPVDPAAYAAPDWMRETAERADQAAEELAQRATMRVPSEIEDEQGELAWPERAQQEKEAILQQPVPDVPAAPEVSRLARERHEALSKPQKAPERGQEG